MSPSSSPTPSTSLSTRKFPKLTHNGINPFYWVETAQLLFDVSHIPPDKTMAPLRRFQETVLILLALYRFVDVCAPSQSGKTKIAELAAMLYANAYPGSTTLILSTNEEQAVRLLGGVKELVKAQKIETARVLTTDNDTEIVFKETKSVIKALPHSIKAVTGHPARFIICDEKAKWDREDPALINAEIIARTGNTGGQVLSISSRFGEGKPDPKSVKGYSGNFFDYDYKRKRAQVKKHDKIAVAVNFTYHVSERLTADIELLRHAMSGTPGAFEEHYLGIPRKTTGSAVFRGSFKLDTHRKPHVEALTALNPNWPLFACVDPGNTKVVILGQVDLDAPRLVYLREYYDRGEKTLEQFVRSAYLQIYKEFKGWDVEWYADVAARQRDQQTMQTSVDVIAHVVGQIPVTEYQNVAPGIEVMRSFMHVVDGFVISDQCPILIEALDSGLIKEERNSVPQDKWVKEGYYEHFGDASRYAPYIITGGMSAGILASHANGATNSFQLPTIQGANPYTGY